MFNKDESTHQELVQRGIELEHLLQSTDHSEQDKQAALMDYLNLLNSERASDLGITFTARMLERITAAFEAHPTADLAVDQLYTCLLLQQFHSMQFDSWRAHPAIEKCQHRLQGNPDDCRPHRCRPEPTHIGTRQSTHFVDRRGQKDYSRNR